MEAIYSVLAAAIGTDSVPSVIVDSVSCMTWSSLVPFVLLAFLEFEEINKSPYNCYHNGGNQEPVVHEQCDIQTKKL